MGDINRIQLGIMSNFVVFRFCSVFTKFLHMARNELKKKKKKRYLYLASDRRSRENTVNNATILLLWSCLFRILIFFRFVFVSFFCFVLLILTRL